MFAYATRFASASVLSLALLSPSISAAYTVQPTQKTSVSYTQNISPPVEEMEPSQRPAPVHGEDQQTIEFSGIDEEALPSPDEVATDDNASVAPDVSASSSETATTLEETPEDIEQLPENRSSDSPESETVPDELPDFNEPGPEPSEYVGETPSPMESPGEPKSTEEQQLAE